MPYLANDEPFDVKTGDIIKVTILENDPRIYCNDKFKIGDTFNLTVENIGYHEPYKEYRYYFDFGPNGFECIFGTDRAILNSSDPVKLKDGDYEYTWYYTNIFIKWELEK
jgi:hypothetical protein